MNQSAPTKKPLSKGTSTRTCVMTIQKAIQELERVGLIVQRHLPSPTRFNQVCVPIATSSALVVEGGIFIAYRGVKYDHHQALEEVASKNPGLIVIEDLNFATRVGNAPWLCVKSSREAWAYLCAASFASSHQQVDLIAVTGTNGKTSTVWFTKALFELGGESVLSLGTLGAFLGAEHTKLNHTTPDPPDLFHFIDAAVNSARKFVVMEASSFAVLQKKLSPLKYSAAAFTSFSRDHLDLHPTMEDYFHNKWLIFKDLARENARLIYHDSIIPLKPLPVGSDTWVFGEQAKSVAQQWRIPRFLQYRFLQQTISGCQIEIESSDSTHNGTCELPFIGAYTTINFLAAYLLTSRFIKLPPCHDHSAWRHLPQVPGRLEICNERNKIGSAPLTVVDYAHTPDAISGVLKILRPLCRGKLWIVFGCGGDRDPGKRPLMAKAANDLADHIIITSDNPRSEPPEEIIRQIRTGIDHKQCQVNEFLDRRKAIHFAIENAHADDVIVVAGKGHEDYMAFKNETIFFDDRLIAKEALSLRS